MKKIYTLVFLVFCISMACNKASKSELKTISIPKLLDRSEKLQYANEWPELKNRFADLEHKIIKNPEDIDVLLQLTYLYITEARVSGEHGHYYPAALQMTEKVLENKKITSDQKFLALSNKASVQLSLHDFQNAYNTAKEALTLNPYSAQIYGALVDACVELGKYEESVGYADKMVSIRPDIRSYSRVSYIREIFGMPEAAIDAFKMAVQAGSPGSEEKCWAALQLAELYAKYNRTNESEAILKQILEEREHYPFAKAALAKLYSRKNQYAEAEHELKEACAIIPEVSFYVQLAEIYQKQNREEELQQTLRDIFTMLEDDMNHGHNMSLEYANLYINFFKDSGKALEYLNQDLVMRPENIEINRMLSKIYLMQKNKGQAEICLKKAQRTNSKDPALSELSHELKNI